MIQYLSANSGSTLSISAQISHLVTLLSRHLSQKKLSMRPGVTAQAISHCEQMLRRPLPTELKSIYQIHDGQHCTTDTAGILHDCRLLTLNELADAHQLRTQASHALSLEPGDSLGPLRSLPPGSVSERLFSNAWTPSASDGGGSYLFIDYSPGPVGVAGQVVGFDVDYLEFRQLAPSLAGMLDLCAKQYERRTGHTTFTNTSCYTSLSEIGQTLNR